MKRKRTPFNIAINWYYQLQETSNSVEEIQQWQEWLAQSNENAQAFKKVETLMCLTASVENVSWPDEREILEDDYDGDVSVKEWLINNGKPTVIGTHKRLKKSKR